MLLKEKLLKKELCISDQTEINSFKKLTLSKRTGHIKNTLKNMSYFLSLLRRILTIAPANSSAKRTQTMLRNCSYARKDYEILPMVFSSISFCLFGFQFTLRSSIFYLIIRVDFEFCYLTTLGSCILCNSYSDILSLNCIKR